MMFSISIASAYTKVFNFLTLSANVLRFLFKTKLVFCDNLKEHFYIYLFKS